MLLDVMEQEQNLGLAQNSGIINPFALAELIAGRKIAWKQVDAPKLLEDILQTPYEELFDPIYEGPLFIGLRLNKNMQLERVRDPLLDVQVNVSINDLEMELPDELNIQYLRDLGSRFETRDIGDIPVRHAEYDGRNLILTLRLPDRDRLQRLALVFSKDIVATISVDPKLIRVTDDWTPPNGTWTDSGQFFLEAAEFFDPIQGAVANCYFIAALSAVAWAMPYKIAHFTRATGSNQQQFTNLVRFYKPDSNGQVDKEIEVTDNVIVNASGNLIYARSSEAGEIWPAIYEKAFAKLETGTTGDRPDITATGWGDCVWATAQLTGGNRYYYDSASRSADDLWNLVRGHSLSYRTFKPMTAWTYSSGAASDKKIVYSDINIAASHCYTVLGWAFRNDQKYIVLRNPWGFAEATTSNLNATLWFYDMSWWRPIALANPDGTFAITASAFKTYFAGIGVVK